MRAKAPRIRPAGSVAGVSHDGAVGGASGQPSLTAAYLGVICDLDGVVYRGPDAIPYAVSALNDVSRLRPLCFATNNASRTPGEVATQLRSLGLTVEDAAVVTSAQAGAQLLAAELPSGSAVLAVGGPGVPAALAAVGLVVTREPEEARAVLQGWGRDVRVDDLARAAVAIAHGARWVATNTDRTLPTPQGLVPGNGTLVSAVAEATGREPEVVGKPHAPLYLAAAERLAAAPERLLAVGDRLDTDIIGATAVGADSLWVLGGVDGFLSLVDSPARPTYAAHDLRALLDPPVRVERLDPASWACGDVRLSIVSGRVSAAADGVTIDMSAVPGNQLAALAATVVLDLRGQSASYDLAVSLATEFDRVLGHSAGVNRHRVEDTRPQ